MSDDRVDDYLLSVDLGTSSLKLGLYDRNIDLLKIIRQPYLNYKSKLKAIDWWESFLKALNCLKREFNIKQIKCISLSGYNAFVGLDKRLTQTTDICFYYDRSPSKMARNIYDNQEQNYIFKKTSNNLYASGLMATAINSLRKKSNQQYMDTDCFLYSNGYIAAKLTHNTCIDSSRSSLTILNDPLNPSLIWDRDLSDFFDIDPRKLPEIYNCFDIVGNVTFDAALESGLTIGTDVVIGSMDSICAALASGVINEDLYLDIGGSAGGLARVSENPITDKKFYFSRFALPGLFINHAPLVASASLFDWFSKEVLHISIEEFNKYVIEAPDFSKGLFFLPLMDGSRYPYWNMNTNGHFINVSSNVNQKDMSRSIVEGLSVIYRDIFLDFNKHDNKLPQYIVAAGGDSKITSWMQIKSNYLRIPICTGSTNEASSKGAAILGAFAMNYITDIKKYIKENHNVCKTYYPQGEETKYICHSEKSKFLREKIYKEFSD